MQSELKALAERVMALTGPDRAALRAIWHCLSDLGKAPSSDPVHCPDYLASLDAAMTLVELPGASRGEAWNVEGWTTNGVHAPHVRATAWVHGAPRVYAATPAVALTAAALLALAEQVQQ